MKDKPNYYAILTADVRYDKRLKPNEKLLFAEITALSQSKGQCWASNQYFAYLYDVSKSTVSRWISNLCKFNYIKSVVIYKEGTKEIINRYISISQYPIDEKVNTPIDEKRKDNNTSNNNTSIIKGKIDFDKLITSYNSIYNKKARVVNSDIRKKYNKLLKEGYLKEDIHNAMLNAKEDAYHKEHKHKFLTLEYFSRSKTMDLYAFIKTKKEAVKVDGNPYREMLSTIPDNKN